MSKKLIVGLAVVLVAVGVAVAPASALTTAEIQALLSNPAVVQQLISALGGTTGVTTATAAVPTFTRGLTVGSTGADVTALQQFLAGKGLLTVAPTGYFGAMTKAALAKYQASVAITPASGVLGPITMAHFASLGSQVATNSGSGTGSTGNTGSTGSTALEGDNGEIDSLTKLSTYNNEEVGAGQEDVKIAGMEIKATTDGDIALQNMKVKFDSTGNTGSTRLTRYFDTVKIWMGDEEIGSSDASDFTKSSDGSYYSKTISLDGATIKAGEKVKFYITVDSAGTIDSTDITGDSWTVAVTSIRFEDGSGVVSTDTTNTLAAVGMDFVTFSTAADTKLKIAIASDTPKEGTVTVSTAAKTDDMVLLKGTLKLEGTSDVLLDQFPVTITVATSTSNGTVSGADAIAPTIKLKLNDLEFSETNTVTSGPTGTVTFDGLDYTIDAGDTVDFEVLADVNEVASGKVAEGDTISASVTSSNRDLMDAENNQGDQLSDASEKTGTATGKTLTLRSQGISVTKVTISASDEFDAAGTSDQLGTYTLRFKVTNTGDDPIYVSSLVAATTTAAAASNPSGKVLAIVDRVGTATVGGVTVSLINETDDDMTNAGTYSIESGTTEEFTLQAFVSLPAAGADGGFRLNLASVPWDTSNTDDTPDTHYTTNLGIGKSVSTVSHGLQ